MITHPSSARLLRTVGVVALLLAVVAVPTFAQTNKGTIKGTVKDQGGAVVQNAQVTITSAATNASRTANTGDDGTYERPAA